jgi:hypothetical protein
MLNAVFASYLTEDQRMQAQEISRVWRGLLSEEKRSRLDETMKGIAEALKSPLENGLTDARAPATAAGPSIVNVQGIDLPAPYRTADLDPILKNPLLAGPSGKSVETEAAAVIPSWLAAERLLVGDGRAAAPDGYQWVLLDDDAGNRVILVSYRREGAASESLSAEFSPASRDDRAALVRITGENAAEVYRLLSGVWSRPQRATLTPGSKAAVEAFLEKLRAVPPQAGQTAAPAVRAHPTGSVSARSEPPLKSGGAVDLVEPRTKTPLSLGAAMGYALTLEAASLLAGLFVGSLLPAAILSWGTLVAPILLTALIVWDLLEGVFDRPRVGRALQILAVTAASASFFALGGLLPRMIVVGSRALAP